MIKPIEAVLYSTFQVKREKTQQQFVDDTRSHAHSEQLQLYNQKGNKWIFQSRAFSGSLQYC